MKVGVIGAGIMGTSIVSYLSVFQNINTIFWKGSTKHSANEKLERGLKEIRILLRKRDYDFKSAATKIKPVESYDDFSDVDIIIEAVTEDLDAKCNIFSQLNKVADARTIIASNTSSLSITALANYMDNPDKVVGIHFFNPVGSMKLVEIIRGFRTSEDVIQSSVEFVSLLDKTPVVVNESPGFIVNRMIIPMINEAISIYAEGVANKQEIDNSMMLGANHPIGPLALSDLIGNDVVLAIMNALHNETGDPKYRAHPLLVKMVRAQALGRKSGNGFYQYKQGM